MHYSRTGSSGRFRPTPEEIETLKMWHACATGTYKTFHAEQIKERLFEIE
jgi:hypothetical protein